MLFIAKLLNNFISSLIVRQVSHANVLQAVQIEPSRGKEISS